MSDKEIMGTLEAFDLTKTPHSAALLAGCDEKTVTRYVTPRDADSLAPVARGSLIDPWRAKIEEWIEASHGKVLADVVHDKLVAMGYDGSARATRRAVAEVKQAWKAGHRGRPDDPPRRPRRYRRPRPPEPRSGTEAEAAFLAIGPGDYDWLTEAAATGVTQAPLTAWRRPTTGKGDRPHLTSRRAIS